MNDMIASLPRTLGILPVGEMLAVLGPRVEARVDRLSQDAKQLVHSIASIVDELLIVTIEKRSREAFKETREDVFPQYFQAFRALSDLGRIMIPKRVREVLASESFSEMEAEFRNQGAISFGTAVRDQAIFTVWTLRKISDVAREIDSVKLTPPLKESDREIFENFAFYSVSTRFHLDCLLKSMALGNPLAPEVLELVIDGLRSSVNAYVWARRALDLRVPKTESVVTSIAWDEEDQVLLDEATFDDVVPDLV